MLKWLRRLFRPEPLPEFQVPGIGTLQFERGIWWGLVPDNPNRLLISCTGDATAPDPRQLDRISEVWVRRSEYFAIALRYLVERETEYPEGAIGSTPYGITYEEWEDADCVIELLGPDQETVWRIAFRGDSPRRFSFDH